MTSMEVMADRYAKFRKLGEFSDFKVKGGRVRAAVEERKQARAPPSPCAPRTPSAPCASWRQPDNQP